MEQQFKKDACVLFRTIVEAAKEMEKDEALEMLLAYADYALGDTEEIVTNNKYIKLILNQVVPALNAAERRYQAAVENGIKGKDAGKKGGRPRKGETKEEAYKRRNPSKTPEETPVSSIEKTPVKPLEVDVDAEVDVDIEKEVSVDKDIEYYVDNFLSNPTKDFRCLLSNEKEFVERNSSDLTILKNNLLNKCNCNYTNRQIIEILKFMYKEKINYKTA